MATISKRSNGKWFIRFVDERGSRKTVSPRTTSERQATVIRLKIENILAAKSTNQPVDPETQRWLVNIKDSLRQKLVKVGLLDPSEPSDDEEVVGLGGFLDGYFSKRNDVKSATKTH